MASSLRGRVMAAMGAGIFGQAVTVAIQLGSLPAFLSRWDAAHYGTWLLLSAMPSYLSMADLGMVATAGNRMTMAMAQRDHRATLRIFHSAIAFVLLACGLAFCVGAGLTWQGIGLPSASADERVAMLGLLCGVLISLIGGLNDILLRSTGRYALCLVMGNLSRLCEWAGYMVGLFVWGHFTAVAWCGAAAKLAHLLCTMVLASRGDHALRWGLREAHVSEIKAQIRPALSFMAFPLANALSFQGVTLLVGQFMGPVMVAAFNTFRTLARVAVQVTAIFGHSLWVEMSTLYGQGQALALRQLYRRSMSLGIVIAVSLSAVLYVMGPLLLQQWTHGRIAFAAGPVAILLIYAGVGGSWHVPRVLLQSTNQHAPLAQWSLLTASLTVALVALLRDAQGLSGVCLAMLVSEALIAGACMVLAHRMLARPVTTGDALWA